MVIGTWNPATLGRRTWLATALAGWVSPGLATAGDEPVRRGRLLAFPKDHGAHTASALEWWYLTGWLAKPDRPEQPTHGFQVTFFRRSTGLAADLPGRWAPRHLLWAHAALTNLESPNGPAHHRHDQRMARWNGQSTAALARAGLADADLALGDWQMSRQADASAAGTEMGERWRVQVRSEGGAQAGDGSAAWALSLEARPSQPLLLQGDRGFSRKGPLESQASHYYSLPQLRVQARLHEPRPPNDAAPAGPSRPGDEQALVGQAWLDHEWSQQLLPSGAVGWDWIGFNLFDGSALTAFRLRAAQSSAQDSVWAGGSFRPAGQAQAQAQVFGSQALRWTAVRHWRSAATAASYPVEWALETPVGRFRVRALLDAQELAAAAPALPLYWEGLSELLDESGNRRLGLGYLEMTGYAAPLSL